MKVKSLIAIFLLFAVTVGAAEGGFPRVYTASVPKAGGGLTAQVDFLKVIAVNENVATIAFLVRDQPELERIQKLSPENLEIEPDLTADLYQQMNYDDGANQQQRQAQDWDSIQGFSCYKSVQGTFDWMSFMVNRAAFKPNLSVTIADIGNSHLKRQNNNNGHDILALKITGNSGATDKGILFVMSGLHAREYAPPELVSRWAESLIGGYGLDADVTAMLDHTEIHLVLQANPDGREVAETDRPVFQRKNRNGSPFLCGDSYGVDLNRNFPFGWGSDEGSSNDPCSQIYRGPEPASEPEVRAIMSYCQSIFPEGQGKDDPNDVILEGYDEQTTKGVFLDVHSSGEIIIWPWNFQELVSQNDDEFRAISAKFRHFNGYENSAPFDGFLYVASGISADWAHGALGVAGMTFELGNEFYQDCNFFLNDILPKNLGALTYAAKISKAPFSLAKGPDVQFLNVEVDGQLLLVSAVASDAAWSDHATSQQSVAKTRMFINDYPSEEEQDSFVLLNGGKILTVDIPYLPSGRHTVYVQATDGAGYKGPVTAAWFTKTADAVVPQPSCVDTAYTNVCQWVSNNKESHPDFCDYFPSVALACPLSCDKCDSVA